MWGWEGGGYEEIGSGVRERERERVGQGHREGKLLFQSHDHKRQPIHFKKIRYLDKLVEFTHDSFTSYSDRFFYIGHKLDKKMI